MTDISIIIVNYNQGRLLRECIQSVQKHTAPSLRTEFIVVDNNSRSEDPGQSIAGLSDVTLIRNTVNRGFGAANNQGLAVARGKYVLFLNNDTIFTEDTLTKVRNFYDGLGGEAIVGCKLLNADGTHQFSIFDFDSLMNKFGEYWFVAHLLPRSATFNKFHLNYKVPDITSRVDVVKGAFMFAGAHEMKALGGFDEDFFFYNEENDLCWRLVGRGGSVWYFPGTSIIHLGGATTESMSYFSVKHLALSYLIYFRKHFPIQKRILYYLMHYSGWLVRVPVYLFSGVVTIDRAYFEKAWNYFRATFQRPRIS
jgi:O-antigen biosynthesis protein